MSTTGGEDRGHTGHNCTTVHWLGLITWSRENTAHVSRYSMRLTKKSVRHGPRPFSICCILIIAAVLVTFNLNVGRSSIAVIPDILDLPSILFAGETQAPVVSLENAMKYFQEHPIIYQNFTVPASNETLIRLYNYSLQPASSTAPWPNLTTIAFDAGRFYSGYRNQMMCFVIFVMQARRQNISQILFDSLNMKDTYGTNKNFPFADLWDLERWNSVYPRLPRLVRYDPYLHDQWNPKQHRMHRCKKAPFCRADGRGATEQSQRPVSVGSQNYLLTAYLRYAGKLRGPFVQN